MKLIETYLSFLNEKEWDEKAKWEDHINVDDLKSFIKQDGKVTDKDLTYQRQAIQPTLMDLIKNTGGDYKGRTTTRNSNHGDYAGIDYILKQMPKDWVEKVKKYVETIAKKHQE